MDKSRRDFFRRALAPRASQVPKATQPDHHGHETTEGGRTEPPVPVETPDIPKLPWRMDNGVKVLRLSSLMAAILVSGCAAAYAPTPLSANHPASAAAPEAPPPPPSQAFSSESLLPAPAEEAPAQGPRAGHGAMQGMHGGH